MRYNVLIIGMILGGVLYSCATTDLQDTEVEEDKSNNNINNTIIVEDSIESKEPLEFSLSEEKYTIIFNEIEMVIEKLNKLIHNKEYHLWLTYLTEDYKKIKGNPEYLKKLSEKPVIKNKKIVLRSLKDYFYYVVVPSRYNAKLDKLKFINETHVKAYTYINNEYIILYYLEKQGNEWKIGSW